MVANVGIAESLLEVILKYTHFPPVVLALDELLAYETTKATIGNPKSHLLVEAVVVHCLKELANRLTTIQDSNSEQVLRLDKVPRPQYVVKLILETIRQSPTT